MGATVRSQFSDGYPDDTFGLITGTFNVSQFPYTPGRIARLKAWSGNGGSIFIGDVRVTGSFPMPWEMAAGDDTGWFALDENLDKFYMNASSGSSYLAFWVQGP
jgi:hypothetical protein